MRHHKLHPARSRRSTARRILPQDSSLLDPALRIGESMQWWWTMIPAIARFASLLVGTTLTAFAAEPLAIGARIPEVTQKNQDGTPVKLAEHGASGFLLVFFYPKANTPGCTKQACSLRDSWEALRNRGVRILGVSADDIESQQAFRTKHKLPYDLLADDDRRVIDAFGVPKMLGFAKRQAYLFKDGILVWRSLEASTEQQAADVLKAIEANTVK
jgi:peroxiredoxin Q/BCP